VTVTPSYVIISPVRDEEQYLERTITSVLAQSIRPLQWIIVDDGSKDATARVAQGYAAQHPWIRVRQRPDRGFRKSGGGVVEAFYDGYQELQPAPWDFLVKLDGDLTLPPDYFEQIFRRFEQNPRLGIGGGSLYHVFDGQMELEKCPRFHVRGATKIYSRVCWEAIGGLFPAPGWDTIDEVKANLLGWETETFDDIKLIHNRPTGTAENRWRDLVKCGRAYYVTGYHPLFMFVKSVYRLAMPPYVIGSLGMAWGFISGYLKHIPQINDPALIKFVRSQQLRRLVGMRSIWR
jgi:biofilm PGA synthesis N-glycosyltransferase PgaC